MKKNNNLESCNRLWKKEILSWNLTKDTIRKSKKLKTKLPKVSKLEDKDFCKKWSWPKANNNYFKNKKLRARKKRSKEAQIIKMMKIKRKNKF